MKKNYSDKQLHKESEKKTVTVEKLMCIRETEAPGFGRWKAGEMIDKKFLVEHFRTNPNFQIVTTKEDK